jgi:hypothetical protein
VAQRPVAGPCTAMASTLHPSGRTLRILAFLTFGACSETYLPVRYRRGVLRLRCRQSFEKRLELLSPGRQLRGAAGKVSYWITPQGIAFNPFPKAVDMRQVGRRGVSRVGGGAAMLQAETHATSSRHPHSSAPNDRHPIGPILASLLRL